MKKNPCQVFLEASLLVSSVYFYAEKHTEKKAVGILFLCVKHRVVLFSNISKTRHSNSKSINRWKNIYLQNCLLKKKMLLLLAAIVFCFPLGLKERKKKMTQEEQRLQFKFLFHHISEFIVQSGQFTHNGPLHWIIKTGVNMKTITLLISPSVAILSGIITNTFTGRKKWIRFSVVWLRRPWAYKL